MPVDFGDATDPPVEATWHGERVAFTGRLGSLSRPQALALLLNRSGQFASHVSPTTTVLVVGGCGLPVNRKGRPTRKLQRARLLQHQGHSIQILDESQFLQRSGIDPPDATRQLFSLSDVERMTNASRDRVRRFIQAKLIAPCEWRKDIPFFDFSDVRLLRDILAILDAGVRIETLRRSLQYLRYMLPRASSSLTALEALEVWGRRVVLRAPDGGLWECSGQKLFDFEGAEAATALPIPRDLFDVAVRCEEAHDLAGAVSAYEELLQRDGPDAEVCFHLANVLYALQRLEEAAERFRQAVELEPEYPEAWNNLGNVLALVGRHADAIEAYERALELDPDWCDARYGLADVLEECGRTRDAALHWQMLLASKPDPDYARYARERLARS
jgi:tetratricopeptide (TPR) repeat protein